ncbi:MAG: tetratricopeptide repeat protein [Myxococcota bacterium]
MVLLPILGALLAGGPVSAADPIAEAKALFDKGLADLEADRYAEACKEIAESQRLDPHPGTLFTLATCESRWGRVATASKRFGEYLALYDTLTPEQKSRQSKRPEVAKEELDKLSVEIPGLTLSLPPDAPSGTVVKRDDTVLAASILGVSQPIDPGEYMVSAQAPGGPIWEQRITIRRKEKKSVLLQVKAAPQTPPPAIHPPLPKVEPSPEEKPSAPILLAGMSAQRKAAYIVGGFGVAGLALSGVTGALALSKKSLIDQNCGSAIQQPDHKCNPLGLEAVRSAQPLGLISTISFAAGLAGVGTGLVLLLTDHKLTTTKVGTSGRELPLHVGFVVDPTGATLGARGVW